MQKKTEQVGEYFLTALRTYLWASIALLGMILRKFMKVK